MKQKYTRLCYSNTGKPLRVKIVQNTDATVEILMTNEDFFGARRSRIKWILLVCLIYLLYVIFGAQFVIANVVFIFSIIVLLYSLTTLVWSEKVTIVKDFGLQTSTTFAFGKVNNLLIPYHCVDCVVINEVIYNLKVILILAVLTKGSIEKEKPIINLFSNLLPNLECLEHFYQIIHELRR